MNYASVSQVSKDTGLPYYTIYQRLRRSNIPTERIGQMIIFERKYIEELVTPVKTKNQTHGDSSTSLYRRWISLKDRCYNPRHSSYRIYGARGVGVCERWHTYENFRDDMGDTFFEGARLLRKDRDRDYSPANCEWG